MLIDRLTLQLWGRPSRIPELLRPLLMCRCSIYEGVKGSSEWQLKTGFLFRKPISRLRLSRAHFVYTETRQSEPSFLGGHSQSGMFMMYDRLEAGLDVAPYHQFEQSLRMSRIEKEATDGRATPRAARQPSLLNFTNCIDNRS